MEDIRFKVPNRKNSIIFHNIFNFFKKNYIKIFIIIILILIFVFPELSGNIIGKWFNIFANSIIKNIQF